MEECFLAENGESLQFENSPKHFEILSENDKNQYNTLRATLSSHLCRNRRGKRLETFSDMLNAIKVFCIRNDEDDWKRCLVCGVCWLPMGLAINTRQLSMLIDKCKSSINGSLQKMGYGTIQSRSESSNALSDVIPVLKKNFNELREWSIRQFIAVTPQPQILPFNYGQYPMFSSPKPNIGGLNEFIPPRFDTLPEEMKPANPMGESNMFPTPDINQTSQKNVYEDDYDPFALPPTFFFGDD